MKIKPLADRVVVKPQEAEETTASGIILPDTAKEKPQIGEVVAVGDGMYSASGTLIPVICEIGDTILYNKHAQLLAIGKLANPVKNRNDVDMNILVRCDLDQDRFAKITDTNEFD